MKSFIQFINEVVNISVAGGEIKLSPEVKAAYDWYTKKYPNATEKNKQYALGALEAAYRAKSYGDTKVSRTIAADPSGKLKAGKTAIDMGKWKTGSEPDYIQQLYKGMGRTELGAKSDKTQMAQANLQKPVSQQRADAEAIAKRQREVAANNRLNKVQGAFRKADQWSMDQLKAQQDAEQKAATAAATPRGPAGRSGEAGRSLALAAARKAGDRSFLPSGDTNRDFKLMQAARAERQRKELAPAQPQGPQGGGPLVGRGGKLQQYASLQRSFAANQQPRTVGDRAAEFRASQAPRGIEPLKPVTGLRLPQPAPARTGSTFTATSGKPTWVGGNATDRRPAAVGDRAAEFKAPTFPLPKPAAPAPIPRDRPNATQIKPGDTYYKLAGGDPNRVKQIQSLNPNMNPNRLPVGGTLKLPPGK